MTYWPSTDLVSGTPRDRKEGKPARGKVNSSGTE